MIDNNKIRKKTVLTSLILAISLVSISTLIPIINADYIDENNDIIHNLFQSEDNSHIQEKFSKYITIIKNNNVQTNGLNFSNFGEDSTHNTNDKDFESYWEVYLVNLGIWQGEDNELWTLVAKRLLNVVGFENYRDWHQSINSGIGTVWDWAFILIFLAFICIFSGELVIGLLGWLISFIDVYILSASLGYSFNGENKFNNKLLNHEVNIILFISNSDGEGIPNLHNTFGGITAINDNAKAECDGTDGKKIDLFTYKMQPIDGMVNGWYSLKGRENPYKKAPCPPGEWTITVGGNNEYNGTTIYIGHGYSNPIEGGADRIIQNIELGRRR